MRIIDLIKNLAQSGVKVEVNNIGKHAIFISCNYKDKSYNYELPIDGVNHRSLKEVYNRMRDNIS